MIARLGAWWRAIPLPERRILIAAMALAQQSMQSGERGSSARSVASKPPAPRSARRRAVRKLPPPEVNVPNLLTTDYYFIKTKDGYMRFAVNPFATAYVVPNPSLPPPKPAQTTDPFLKDLNEGEPFSLLNNKAPWTLLVRVFNGTSAYQSESSHGGFLDKLPFAPHQTETKVTGMEMAAHSAQGAAEWLQAAKNEKIKILPPTFPEAYVLHTRESSLLTVGGFDGPDDPRMKEVADLLSNNPHFKQLHFMQPMLALQVPRP